jgi:ABC-type transport system involved in multi-copper enzyme maturation permease subunit
VNGTVIAETVRRNCTNLLYVSFAILLVMIAFAVGRTENPGAIWTTMLTLFVLAAGAQLIGPEFSSGTLQLILVKPVNRSAYLLSRWLGVVVSVALVAWLAFAAEAISRMTGGTTELIGKTALVTMNASLRALLVTALLALFGTFLRAYFNVGLYLVLNTLLAALMAVLDLLQRADRGFFAWLAAVVRKYPIVRRSLVWIDENLYPEAVQGFDRSWMLLVLTNAALALLLACFIFRRREVPYGAD